MGAAKQRPQVKISRRRGACRRCKEKKRRCDGRRPRCSNCESSFHHNHRCECIYDSENSSAVNASSKNVDPLPQLSARTPNHLPGLSTESVAENIKESYLQTCINDQWELREPFIVDSEDFGHPSNDHFKQFLAFESYKNEVFDFESANQNFSSSEGLLTPLASSNSEKQFWQSSDRMIYDSSTFLPTDQSSSLLQSLFPSPSLYNKDGAAIDQEDEFSQELLCGDSAITSIICHPSIVRDLENSHAKYKLQELLSRISLKLKRLQAKREAEPLSGISLPLPQVFDINTIRRHVDTFSKKTPSSFIFNEQIEEILDRYTSHEASSEEAVIPLVHALTALGCLATEKTGKYPEDGCYPISSNLYFEAAMASSRGLLLGKPSIMKIQALLAMSLFCENLNKPELHASLIANTVQLVLSMRLNHLKSIQLIATSSKERILFQRIFWIVYSMEKPAVMRSGRNSAIDDDFIDYPPGPHLAEGCLNTKDFLVLEKSWSYAKVCSTIKKCLYGPSLVHSRSEISDASIFLETITNDWKDSLADRNTLSPSDTNMDSNATPIDVSELEDKFLNFKQQLDYYEVLITIYQSGIKCLQPSRAILKLIHSHDCPQTKPDIAIIMLSSIAFVNIAINTITHPNSAESHQNMAYLGIGLGVFGKLAMNVDPDEIPFMELGELFCTTQRALANAL